jgi:hypothetical protein
MTLKTRLRLCAPILVCVIAAHASDTLDSSHVTNTVLTLDSDTVPQTLPLLPDRLGPMETLLWSEHGFMRNHFDFPLTEEGREREMGLRRTMLTAHETAGFATLAAMITTCIVGQYAYDKYPKSISPGLGSFKSTLGWTTVAMYFGTASLSIFSPPPLIRRHEWSSVSTHKLLAVIDFTGILLTPILASGIGNERRGNFSRTVETVHMVSGYTTTAAFAASMLVIVF